MATADTATGTRPGAADAEPGGRERPARVGWQLGDWGPTTALLLGVYAAVRIVLLVAELLAAHVSYGGDLDGPLEAWDAHYYLVIALHGYPTVAPLTQGHLAYSAAGFEPVFPAFIRLFAVTGLPVEGAALVVSLIAGAAATLLVWRLGRALGGEALGVSSAVLFATFPGMGVDWGIFYSESVGLALVAAALLLMLRQRWVWAGLAGALASATSPLALPLAVGALVAAVGALRRRERPGALVTAALVPTGFVAFALWLGLRYHDLLFWWHLQHQAWGADIDGGRSLVALLGHFWGKGYQGTGWLEWIGVVAVAAACVALWRARLPGVVTGYCLAVFVLLVVSNQLGFKPRLLTWAFPALVAVASVAGRRWWLVAAIGFAALLPLVFLAYTLLGNTVVQP